MTDPRIVVRVTPEQRDLIAQAAKWSGLSVSAWVRSLALGEARAVAESGPPPRKE